MRRCHPGGEALTKRLISLAAWGTEDTVLDIGCGEGASTALLRTCCSPDCRGIDTAPAENAPDYIIKGDACALPFNKEAFDGILFECSLSVIRDPETAVKEAFRTLKKGGRLALANLTAQKEEAGIGGLGRLEFWEKQKQRMEAAGFSLIAEEDATEELLSLFGELILNGEEIPGGAFLRKAKPGYRISIWKK